MKNGDYCSVHNTQFLSDITITPKDFMLFRSSVAKVLSYGDDELQIAKRIQNLRRVDPDRFKKLMGICERLDFKERLRHSAKIMGRQGEEQFLAYQLDRLVAYLTATCIDVAGGKGKFYQYYDWVRKSILNQPSANTSVLIKELILAQTEAEVIRSLDKGMNPNLQSSSVHEYLEEQGVRRGFVRVLNSLDTWLKNWLSETYVIVKDNIVKPDVRKEWMNLSAEEKYIRITKYLFDLRNTYTHSIEYRPTLERTGSYITLINNVRYHFYAIYDETNEVQLEVGVREGWKETDVIQLMIVAYLRNNWLYLNDSQSFIETYHEKIRYRQFRSRFLSELQANLNLLQAWCSIHLFHSSYSSTSTPLAKVSTEMTEQFLSFHEAKGGGYLGVHANPSSYLQAVETLNVKIEHFNQSKELEDPFEVNKFLASLCNLRESTRIANFITDVTYNFVQNELYY